MGETPASIKRQMTAVRTDLENTLGALKIGTAMVGEDAKKRVTIAIDDAGTRAGDFTAALASKTPKPADPTPLLVACALTGFAAAFFAPLSDFERVQLQPVAAELSRRAKNARKQLLG